MIPLRSTPLPPFRSGAEVRRRAAEALRPPSRIRVSEAAARHRRLNNPGAYVGPWRNEKTPYLAELMDRALQRDTDELFAIAPSQTAKTEIHLNICGHGIKYRPAEALLFQPTKDLAEDFAVRRITNKFLRPSPDLESELGPAKSDDNVMTKRFKNGFTLTVSWPSPAQLSSRPVQLVLIDERDRMADDIGGEGDPIALGRKRKQTFGRNGALVCTSSPSRIDGTGIIAHWPAGDQCLLNWPCPDCGEFWAPGFTAERKPDLTEAPGRLGDLRWDPNAGTPAEARETAYLECPCCAARITERNKPAMLREAVWLPLGVTISAKGERSGTPPKTRVASYWLTGLASPFQPLGELAEKFLAAQAHFERTGEENDLKTFFNTDLGVPYKPRHDGAAPLEPEALDARRGAYELGTVPAEVRFLTASVDIQNDRFEVLVRGWNETTESWLVDRYAIRTMPDGRTDVRPSRHPEQWDLLLDQVVRRSYPMADNPGLLLPVANTAIDTGGHEDVTANAKAFWRRARKAGVPDWRITLVKG
ncbi:MAG: phage terminase large subunit family protein, partial [Rhodospirillales bacterium]|nr:phage terminase large subunit family protein [Rhodospirillales bacterium]